MALARKRFRRRAGIEPIIGHLKSGQRLEKNFLEGFFSDQINLLMAAVAFNFRKWMREVIFCLDNSFLKIRTANIAHRAGTAVHL
jgi:hypothetical protein